VLTRSPRTKIRVERYYHGRAWGGGKKFNELPPLPTTDVRVVETSSRAPGENTLTLLPAWPTSPSFGKAGAESSGR